MSDIEKARRFFRDEGLLFPTIPEALAARLKEEGNRRLPMGKRTPHTADIYIPSWLYTSTEVSLSPYNPQHYVREAGRGPVEDYVILCHSGYGANSYAIQYYIVHGSLRMFLHLAWGGVYMDKDKDAVAVRNCFLKADQVVRAAARAGRFQAEGNLTVVGSDFYGSYWSPPGKSCRSTDAGRDVKPVEVLTEALAWLTSYRGKKRSERRTAMPIPRIQSLLLPVLRIVKDGPGCSVEGIRNGVKNEFKLTAKQVNQKHSKSGINVFVNHVAWALAHLVMGKAIEAEGKGFYQMTERGLTILNGRPSGLTIRDLH